MDSMSAVELEPRRNSVLTGLAAAGAATTMLFAALLSAYVVRRGISDDWIPLPSSAVPFASILPSVGVSLLLSRARKKRPPAITGFLLTAAVLAGISAMMHLWVWKGISLLASPSASFFFVLDSALLVYMAAGVFALLWACKGRKAITVEAVSYYWLYVNALCALVLAFLFVWR